VGENVENQRQRLTVSDRPLRAILVDQAEGSADPLSAELARTGREVVLNRVDTEDALASLLRTTAPDVVFTTSAVTQCATGTVLRTVQSVRPTVPVILLSDVSDQQVTVACVRAGIENVVWKDRMERVAEILQNALEVRRPLSKLSPRQIEVLRLIAQGLTTKQIAQHLVLSEKTIETHRSAVAQRLGIRDVAGLVRYAVRVGLASQAPPFDAGRREAGGGLAAGLPHLDRSAVA
jgi:DNA-binding NarL/FixJ family response regulator